MPPIITGSYIMQHRTESTFILHSGCEFRAVFTILPACTASWNGIFFFFSSSHHFLGPRRTWGETSAPSPWQAESLKASPVHYHSCRGENTSLFLCKSVLPGHCCLWFWRICNSKRSGWFSSKWKRRSRWWPIYSAINIFKDKCEVHASLTHTTLLW